MSDQEKTTALERFRSMDLEKPNDMAAILVESGYLTPQRRLGNVVGNTGNAMRWPWDPVLFRLEREIMDPMLRVAVVKKRDAHDALAEALKRARAT